MRRSSKRSSTRKAQPAAFDQGFESLENRLMPAITATFAPDAGILTVLGDAQDNTIVISRDAAGTLQVNGGDVAITGGTATVANTATIDAFGLNGNDTITLDEVNGALPQANLFGGAGNDMLTGRLRRRPALRPGGQRHPAGQGGHRFALRWRRQRHAHGRRRRRPWSSAKPATTG